MQMPQWSPVMKTGNTGSTPRRFVKRRRPQWSPVMKTGNTRPPGSSGSCSRRPQWSPVMKTGNTWAVARSPRMQTGLNGARS